MMILEGGSKLSSVSSLGGKLAGKDVRRWSVEWKEKYRVWTGYFLLCNRI